MTLKFDGQVAIVTGAGNGLGRAYAHALAERGARVVVNDLGSTARGEGADGSAATAVVEEIVTAGGEAAANTASVSTPEGAASVVATALDAFGRIDVVVNNAGILRDKAFHKMALEDWDSVLDVHLRGSFFVTQAAFPHLRDQGYGRIVMTTSPAGLYGNFGQSNYGAAKMGIVGLARTLAHEGARANIRTNVIAPAALTRLIQGIADPSKLPPLPAELVAPVVVFLSHERCELNGQILSAGGGRVGAVVIEEARGYYAPDLSAEEVEANLGAIFDRTHTMLPAGLADTAFWLKDMVAGR